MKRDELTELHYIAPFENVVSICRNGILSHNKATHIHHKSVAMLEIQERRKKKKVYGGRPLHDYVNLYISVRNPMMYKIKDKHKQICVLSVSVEVLDVEGTVISDRNASSGHVRFSPAPGGLTLVDRNLVFAKSWKNEDQLEEWRRKSIKCAEVLVPDRVEAQYVRKIYVSCVQNKSELEKLLITERIDKIVEVNGNLFFQ